MNDFVIMILALSVMPCIFLFTSLFCLLKGLPPGYKFYERSGRIFASNSSPYNTKKGYRTKIFALRDAWWDYNWHMRRKRLEEQGKWKIKEVNEEK